ncbi:hypothetical protein GIB67_034294 [Kingdonia uniflora]|uniref:Uncharacterized protein n=1 Tax=Kingdonia uniflora TaxID=39325 RepID=A0A7J7NSE9_9MAGN|nr:hypothetical protein GIB67_034294 [Kingdonia uniflora]
MKNQASLQAKNISWYLPLYEAALKGDWESANRFFDLHPDAIIVKLPQVHMTALHIAVGAGHSNPFVEKLVELMPLKALQLQTEEGDSALAYAAITGNTTAAKIIIRKDPNLPNMQDAKGKIPLRYATQHGHRETLLYLLSVTNDNVIPGSALVEVIKDPINAGFYYVALLLLQRNPDLANWKETFVKVRPLYILARAPSTFQSGRSLTFWQHLVYKR